MKKLLLLVPTLCSSLITLGQQFVEMQKTMSEWPYGCFYYGTEADIFGDYAVITELGGWRGSNAQDSILNRGIAQIYKKVGGVWTFEQHVYPFDGGALESYGTSAELGDSCLFVGAGGHPLDASSSNYLDQCGAVFVYTQQPNGDWIYTQKLVAPDRDTATWLFGRYMDLHNDWLAVGSLDGKDVLGGNHAQYAGAVYIYQRDALGQWNFFQKIVAPDRAAGDRFHRVSINGDQLVVGARYHSEDVVPGNTVNHAGAVYYFVFDGVEWGFQQKLVVSDREEFDFLGHVVEVKDDHLFVSAGRGDDDVSGIEDCGAVYYFQRDNQGVWQETAKMNSPHSVDGCEFGESLCLSDAFLAIGDDNAIKVTSNQDTIYSVGMAYVYQNDGSGNWNLFQSIQPSDAGGADFFTHSLEIDGDHLLATSPHDSIHVPGASICFGVGSAYFYELKGEPADLQEMDGMDARIYPNPFTHEVNIEIAEEGVFKLLVYSAEGKKVYDRNDLSKGVHQIHIGSATGMYLVELSSDRGMLRKRILKL